jgi:hypothetical protein
MRHWTDWIAANVRISSFHVRHAVGRRNMLLLLHGPSLATTRPVSQAGNETRWFKTAHRHAAKQPARRAIRGVT